MKNSDTDDAAFNKKNSPRFCVFSDIGSCVVSSVSAPAGSLWFSALWWWCQRGVCGSGLLPWRRHRVLVWERRRRRDGWRGSDGSASEAGWRHLLPDQRPEAQQAALELRENLHVQPESPGAFHPAEPERQPGPVCVERERERRHSAASRHQQVCVPRAFKRSL